MPSDGTTIGIWIGKEDRLLDDVDDHVDWRGSSRSDWLRNAARERIIVDDFFQKTGIAFDNEVERRNEIKGSLREFYTDQENHPSFLIECGKCESEWSFTEESEANGFYEQHEEHTSHRPTKFVEIR